MRTRSSCRPLTGSNSSFTQYLVKLRALFGAMLRLERIGERGFSSRSLRTRASTCRRHAPRRTSPTRRSSGAFDTRKIATSQRDNLEKETLPHRRRRTRPTARSWISRRSAQRGSSSLPRRPRLDPRANAVAQPRNTTIERHPEHRGGGSIDFFTVLLVTGQSRSKDDSGFAVASAFSIQLEFSIHAARIRSDTCISAHHLRALLRRPLTLTLHPGGAGYVRFGVASGRTDRFALAGRARPGLRSRTYRSLRAHQMRPRRLADFRSLIGSTDALEHALSLPCS